MQKILVKQAFTLQRDDGTTEKFKPGINVVSEADAEHWFLKLHSEPVQDGDAESVAEMQQIHAELLAAKEALEKERQNLDAEKADFNAEKAELLAAKEAFLAEKSALEKAKKAKVE